MLAGDGMRCDYPVALMERAATTGCLAANELLPVGAWPGTTLDGPDAVTAPGGPALLHRPLARLRTAEVEVSRGIAALRAGS